MKTLFRFLAMLLPLLSLAGCRHIGPETIVEDRVPYNDAIATSWKQQTLLNLVRLRYADIPEFVDVASIVNGYEHGRTTVGSLGTTIYLGNHLANVMSFGLGGTRSMADRPTISYKPQSTSEFTRNLINPISPVLILNLIEGGTPADVIMDLAVESINGIRNHRTVRGQFQPADPEFKQASQILAKAQASGQFSLRIVPSKDRDKDKKDADVLIVIKDNDPTLAKEIAQLQKILRLDTKRSEFKVVFGLLPLEKDEIAFRTRPVVRVMSILATNVQVPESHLAEGRAPHLGDTDSAAQPKFMVHSGCEKPSDCYAAVQYQGYWFWIDNRDFHSKRSMAYLKILLALADTSPKEPSPVLTIRAN